MDNYKVYFYVIIFVIWLVNQIRKSGKNNPVSQEVTTLPDPPALNPIKGPKPLLTKRETPKSLSRDAETKKPFKFDDFFEELDKSIKPQKENIPPATYNGRNYEAEIIDEEESIKRKLEKDRLAAINQRKQRVALSDEHLQHYAVQDTASKNKYEEMLKNPQDLKTALILGEILNRKY